MWDLVIRYGTLAAAILLALVVGEYALIYRPTSTSTLLGIVAAIVLGAGFLLGRAYFRRDPVPHPFDPDELGERLDARGISSREYEVLELVAGGLSNREIAERLYIAETTVKSHVSSLLAKLQARRRTEAVSIAQEEGLLP